MDVNAQVVIGNAIAAYLKERGMSQKRASEISGVDAQTVCDIVRGAYSIGKINATRLHEAFGFDIEFLRTGIGTLLPINSKIESSDNANELIAEYQRQLKEKDVEIANLKAIIAKQKMAISALNDLV